MLKSLCASALAVCTLTLGVHDLAQADEGDWLYFPMYERDTAHAVHLSALRFRPDGLLASATRYPRVSGETWTQEESDRGWYGYQQRLIDCETGYFVETTDELLDRDGKKVASRTNDHAKWVERLTGLLQRNQGERWPQSGGEIFLACAGASSPTLKAQRARQAKAPRPLVSYTPLVKNLSADSAALFELREMRFDFTRIDKRPPATPVALFDQLRRQYTAWRKSINLTYTSEPGISPTLGEQVQRKANAALKNAGSDFPDPLRVLNGGVIEYVGAWDLPWGTNPPAKAAQARYATETLRGDCASGVRVAVARHWRDGEGKVLLQEKVPVREAIAQARRAVEHDSRAQKELCSLVARIAAEGASTPSANASSDEDEEAGERNGVLRFGLTAEDLVREQTPEAMLLKIRSASRARLP